MLRFLSDSHSIDGHDVALRERTKITDSEKINKEKKKKNEKKKNLLYVLFKTLCFHFCHLHLFNIAFSAISGRVDKMFSRTLVVGGGLYVGMAQNIITSLEYLPSAQPCVI